MRKRHYKNEVCLSPLIWMKANISQIGLNTWHESNFNYKYMHGCQHNSWLQCVCPQIVLIVSTSEAQRSLMKFYNTCQITNGSFIFIILYTIPHGALSQLLLRGSLTSSEPSIVSSNSDPAHHTFASDAGVIFLTVKKNNSSTVMISLYDAKQGPAKAFFMFRKRWKSEGQSSGARWAPASA